MESLLPGFQMPFQRRLSRLYNDTKKSSDFVKEPVQNEEDPEIKALHRKLRIQKDRLVSWGLEWSDPNQSTEIDESLSKAGLSEVVGSIMSTIKDILAEAEPLWQSSKHLVDPSRPSGDRKAPLVRWDKSRFEDLVRDLTSSIDTLFDLSNARLGLLPGRTSKSTMKSPTSEDFKPFESSRYLTPQHIDPAILTPATPAQTTASPSRSVVYMSKTEYGELTQAAGVRQPWAPLLLEYAAFDPMFSEVGIMPDMKRFEKLSACLQQDPQLPAGSWTGLPRLLGYFDDLESSRLGLVYRFPASFNAVPSVTKPTSTPIYNLPSLKDVLCQPQTEPPMEVKFRLAHNLANTIFDLHARGITHGNIHDSNISFCVAGPKQSELPSGEVDLRRPLLSSFDLFPEYSESSVSSVGKITRHPMDPRCTTPSSPKMTHERAWELYSLGMVLLSVGLWTRLEDLVSEGASKPAVDSLLNQLSVRCGTLYMKAVQAFLSAADTAISGDVTDEESMCAVQMKASRYLEACCILDGVSGLEGRVSQELQDANSSPRSRPLKQLGKENLIKDVKSPSMLSADVKSSPQRAVFPTLSAEEESDPMEAPAGQPSKPEGKIRLYPHVPLAPHVVEKWNIFVMPQINQALRGFYKKHPESVEISLESVGPNPQATQPTVLIVCTSVGKVRAILKKRMGDFFDGSSGFGLKVCRGSVLRSRRHSKPVLRSMDKRSQASRSNGDHGAESDDEADATNPKYQEKPVNGASIGAWIGDRHLPPVSFGGLVTVDKKLYGMTVHHMLDDPDQDFGLGDANRSMANPEFEWSPDSFTNTLVDEDEFAFDLSDSESETYSDTDITSEYDEEEYSDDEEFEAGDIPGIEPGCGEGYIVTQPAFDDVDEGFFPSAATEDEDHLDSHKLGEVYASSGIRRRNANGLIHEVDWALFQFAATREPSDNAMPQAATHTSSGQAGELRPTTVAPFNSLPGMDVQCVARTSGLQTGKILPALTSVKIYGRTSTSHTYQITSTACDEAGKPSSSTFPMGIPGDSGAWIVDREQGQLCGHVLAWSQRKHVAYICPMEVLLQDIAETLEATEICLPGAGQPVVQLHVAPHDIDSAIEAQEKMDQLALDHGATHKAGDDSPATETAQQTLAQAQRSASTRSLGSPASLGSPMSQLSRNMSGFGLQSGPGIGVSV